VVRMMVVPIKEAGKAIRGNESQGHSCKKQGAQSRKVLRRIMTGLWPSFRARCATDEGGSRLHALRSSAADCFSSKSFNTALDVACRPDNGVRS